MVEWEATRVRSRTDSGTAADTSGPFQCQAPPRTIYTRSSGGRCVRSCCRRFDEPASPDGPPSKRVGCDDVPVESAASRGTSLIEFVECSGCSGGVVLSGNGNCVSDNKRHLFSNSSSRNVKRRQFATALLGGGVTGSVAGCFAEDSRPEQSPSTSTSSPAVQDVLPEARNGWQLRRSDELPVRHLGGESGITGYYTSPEGIRFRVVVIKMKEDYSTATKAEGWACIGWDVGVAYRGFAFAAGTGTRQGPETFTPETPPHMTRTPVPGTAMQSKELLSYSPLLSRETIEENEHVCDDSSLRSG